MGWSYTYYSSRLHRTFNSGDTMIVQGTAYTSTDKNSVGIVYSTPEERYFYGVYSAEYAYAPICIGFNKIDGAVQPNYYIEDSSIVSGGTLESHEYSFNAAGGSGGPGKQLKYYGIDFTFPSTIPTRSGHTFLGWANSAVNNATVYKAGQTVNGLPDNQIEWWAQWSEWTYTVSYNANGGSGAPGNQIKRYTSNLTLSNTKPTRSGYSFQGWATSKSGSVTYQAGGTYSTNADITLYAIWIANNYTLTVNPNGGIWSDSTSSQTFTQAMDSTKTIPNPTRTGHTFAKWEKTGLGSMSGTIFKFGAGNTTLKATWNINSYTLTVNPNGGVWSGVTTSQTYTQNYGTTKNIVNPTRTGYIFKNWSLSGGGSLSGTTYKYGASNGTLTAVWERIVYTVTFNATANSGSPDSTKNINHGDKIGNLPTPVKPYYKFIGWFTEIDGGTQVSAEQIITGNVTYYAQFKIDASASLVVGGKKKPVIVYIRKDDVWKKALAMVKIGGQWKNSTGSF